MNGLQVVGHFCLTREEHCHNDEIYRILIIVAEENVLSSEWQSGETRNLGVNPFSPLSSDIRFNTTVL